MKLCDLTEFTDDELMEYDILSRRTEITLPSAERRGVYQPATAIGHAGGSRHRVAIAPIPAWVIALICALVVVVVVGLTVALAWCIAMGIDWIFWHLGQWSAA